ncbi:MAG TPA: NUDIX domain-containing protein [Acidimicrobiales bacterium]
MTFDAVTARAHRGLLRFYRVLPRLVRRWVVRLLAPSFTVGATCMIERPDGHILLVRQAYRHRWGVPGGLLKRGEDPASGARREVFEEVGIAVELLGPPVVVVDPRPQRIDLVFRARPLSLSEIGEVRPSSPEIVAAQWFAPDALPELQVETADAFVALARARSALPTTD